MSDLTAKERVLQLEKLLGWVYQRSRAGCFSKQRSERDQALADINYWTVDYRHKWTPEDRLPKDPLLIYFGESP